jgi:hypothetical protein
MKHVIGVALLCGAMSTAVLATGTPAVAQIGISLNFGDVGIAYQDGYWDQAHHWHKWRNNDDWTKYRQAHPENYHDWRHDDPHHR